MSGISGLSGQDLVTRRTGADYLKLYGELKATAEKLDNGPEDWLTRGGEVSVIEQNPAKGSFSLSYQRPDVIARESLILHRETPSEEPYQTQSLELGHEGSLLKVTHSQDTTRDVFGDETRTVLYVDPRTGELCSPR